MPNLPRLVYIGDVPVESSYHGSALLFRLLQNYPPGRLLIIEGNLRSSLPTRRLERVNYRSLTIGWRRPLYTRFNRWATLTYSFAAQLRFGAVRRVVTKFQPEAVLSVAHEFLWLTAARYAANTHLPLHLVCHDDWPSFAPVPELLRPWLDRHFRQAYRQARSRFCVCSPMANEYQRRYGVPGTVLYPCRAADAPRFEAPPDRLLINNGGLRVAFAGTINSRGHVRALQNLARTLEARDGRLLIFGPLQSTDATACGLARANIELRGLVPSAELMRRLRAEADVLFVPMSFEPTDRAYSAFSFPSKLTDYTAVGLPLLIHGPDYCSAVRWAKEHAGLAELATDEKLEELSGALERLSVPKHRWELAENAMRTGESDFAHDAVQHRFLAGLASQ